MIDLYMAGTSNGLRAAVVLAECELAHTVHKVDLMKGEHRQPAYLMLNPAGLIPTIIDSEGPGGKPLTLSQSGAIVLYCAEKSGRFIPSNAARRALAMQWFMQAASDVAGAGTIMFFYGIQAPDKTPANAQWLEQRFLNALSVVDQHLADHQYLADEIFDRGPAAIPQLCRSQTAHRQGRVGLRTCIAGDRPWLHVPACKRE